MTHRRWKTPSSVRSFVCLKTSELREYYFRVTLHDNGKFKESDKTAEKATGIDFSDGKLTIGGSKNTFKGKTNQKSFQLGIGQDRQSGEVGLVGFALDTSQMKTPIRKYLTNCGWKKAGLFG